MIGQDDDHSEPDDHIDPDLSLPAHVVEIDLTDFAFPIKIGVACPDVHLFISTGYYPDDVVFD